jgi:plasmid stabilization system protein ParE
MTDSRRPVIWSAPARTDLSDVWDYRFKAAGRQTADRIVRGVVEACQLPETHSLAGCSRNAMNEEFQ